MSKISELGPIFGANTRSEDLFVIVNLIQGDDGTKSITRKELVEAIQYEVFSRIEITGGSISNVVMFDSDLSNVTIADSIINRNTINDSTLNRSTINTATATDVDMSESAISDSTMANTAITTSTFTGGEIRDSFANNVNIRASSFYNGELANSTGNNMIFVNSTIDDSTISNSQFNDGTANNIAITGGTATDLAITNSDFSNGTGNNNVFTNTRLEDVTIEGGTANNLIITNLELDEVEMTDVIISRGTIDSVDIANSNFIGGLSEILMANSEINTTDITQSDFSNGTGNNNLFTSTTLDDSLIQNSIIANSTFQGGINDVTIGNARMENSTIANTTFEGGLNNVTMDNAEITNSEFKDGTIKAVELANVSITDSDLINFDVSLEPKFERAISDDAYFVLKNVQTGKTEQITYKQLNDEIGRTVEKALKVHVAVDGDDNHPGSILQPVRTLARASELAIEKAGGNPNRNDINNAIAISCGPGTYYVDEPIVLPDDCSLTSTGGQYVTVIQKKPGWEKTNGILVGSGCYVQGFSYMNFEVDNFDQPEGGFAIAYRPGALMRRSPYIRDSSQLSNFNRLDVEPPLNPFNSKGTILDLGQEFYLVAGHSAQSNFEVNDEVTFSSGASGYISYIDDIDSASQIYVRNLKGNVEPGDILYAQSGGTGTVDRLGIDDFPNREVGRGGGCVLCDRAVLDTDSLYTYLLCFGFTPRTQNGTGYVAKNGAGINGIGSLSIFTRQAFFALDGGQVTLNNSGSQFGDISMRARGKTTIIKPAEGNNDLFISNTAFADVLEERKGEIVDDMIDYLTANTTTGYNGAPGLGYQGYNADKCFRDTGIIVDNVGLDIATNSNYWGRLNGITYRSPISYVVVNEQLTETVGSIEHLRAEMTDGIFANADAEVSTRINFSLGETLNILQNGEEFANNISFADTGVGPAVAARETVQDNRAFIIEEFVDWLDNNPEFFAYDSAKCKRDVREYILPAVKYDAMLDTNYNSVTAGNAYYFNAAKNVIGGQRAETIAAYERLRLKTDEIIEANSAPMAVEAYEKFNEIISILKQDGDKFTPTNATYNPTTGDFVITIGTHSLDVGRYILLMPEAFTFTCDTDNNKLEFKHPRKSDPAFKSAMPITAKTATTITLNVGSTGYKGVHTFVEALDNSVIVLGSAITFSDNANIPADKRNARKQLQANRAFIQDYMMGWADNEWFFYDSAKCQRDMKEYIIPAVTRDMQLGTNFNSIQSGIAYRQGISKVAVNDQLDETVGAIEFLRDETANTVTSSIANDRLYDAFNEVVGIAKNQSKKYTPTAADYNANTGVMEVTIGAHDFQVGDVIIIEPNSMTFSCPEDGTGNPINITHPRTTDPIYNTAIPIYATTATTITVNVGEAKVNKAHTFVSADTNAIRDAGIYNGKFTPTDVDYDPISGDMEITIGQHELPVGKWISIADESITLSCANTSTGIVTSLTHPRPTEPAFRQPVRITATTGTTITVNVANANGYQEDHSFVSADVDCIDTNAIYWTDAARIDSFHTPSTATYDPATGAMELTMGSGHGFTTDDHIEFKPNSIVFSCANTVTSVVTEISHPRIGEPNYQKPLPISATTATTITVNPGAVPNGYSGAHTFVSAEEGSVIKTRVTRDGVNAAEQLINNRTFLQAEVDAWIRDNYFVYKEDKCRRDTGFILDAVRRDMATGSNVNSVFAGLAYRTGNASAQLVIDDQLTETVGAITWLKGEVANLTSGTGQTRSNAAFDEIIDIMQNGTGAADARSFGTDYISADALKAREALQANKAFLQDEVTSWVANTYPSLVYNQADCERDLGYFIDAVSWDIQHGSNAATINNARVYFDNAVSVLAQAEKPATAAAYQHIAELAGGIVRGERVTAQTPLSQNLNGSSDSVTPTDATYNPNTGIMEVTVNSHGFEVGQYIVIEDESITFSCPDGGGTPVNISHPRATDPYFNTPVRIDEVTTNTFTVYVGTAQGYTGTHTFVGADANAVRLSVSPEISGEVEKLFRTISDIIEEDDYNETFLNGGYGTGLSQPQIKEPTLTGTGYSNAINEMYERIAGDTAMLQEEIIEHIRETYNGLAYNTDKCYRDIGYIVDAIAEDIEYGGNAATVNAAAYYFDGAVSVLPYEQREPTRLAYEHLANVVENIVTETTVTPTTGNSETQDTSGTAATASTGTTAKDLVNVVSGVIELRRTVPDYTGSLDISVGQQTLEALPAANTSAIPLIEPSRTFARKSLQMNKEFIQNEVVAYINDQYFTYDEDKCARDAAYILDAVAYDIATGGDYHGKYAGKAYRAGTTGTDKVIEEQLAETIEGINYLQRDIEGRLTGVAKTRATASFERIKDAMTNDYDPESVDYDYGTAFYNVSATNAKDALQANKAFLQAEAIAWMADNHPFISYDTAKCQRDVGYMIDAVCADIIHQSNSAMRDVAQLYFENGLSTLPADQRSVTADLYRRLGDFSVGIALKQVQTKSTSNAQNQVTTGFSAAGGPEANQLDELWDIVADAVAENTLLNLPAETLPGDAGGSGYDYNDDRDRVRGRTTDLAAGINAYLQKKFDYLEYDQVKCKRDVGYMVDAISHDIQYGGNSAMWNAAQIYFVNMTNLLPLEQREPTKKAFSHMADIMHDVIRNESITKTAGNSSTQNTSNLAARRTIAMEAKNLALMVADIADDNNPDNLPARVEPYRNWIPASLVADKDLIDDTLEDLVTSMINHISTEYNGISYPKEKCRRDVGIIVDALSHDVQYETNYATRLSANMYFDNATSVLPFDQRTQTADFYEKMANLVSEVIQETAATDASEYTSTAQDTSGTAATATEGEWAADMVRIIEEAIRRDNLDAVPELIEPNTSWVDASKVWAASEIDANLNVLADDVTQHISENFTIIDYSKAKCRRDAGYIIDAMSWDLNYGGNLASRWNADFYYWNNELRIPENTRVATAQAYRQLGKIVSEVVTGDYPGQKLRPEMGDEERATQAYDLGMIFFNALFYNTPKALGPTIEPDFTWDDDNSKIFRFSKDILENNKVKLQREVQRFITSTYKFIDLPKTYRDAGNLIKILQNDFRFNNASINLTGVYNAPGAGGDKAMRSFAAALFNIDSQHVFPVFNPPSSFSDWRKLRFKGTIADVADLPDGTGDNTRKRFDAYIVPTNNAGNRYVGNIYYWTGSIWQNIGANNVDLLESFYLAWRTMKNYINTNIAPDAEHQAMVTELFDNVLEESVLRPNFLAFGSLVESIAHQFNGASAGVNRNALPLNFRNIGAAIGATASVLTEDGGRVRWSGSDELNNQYFARGLRINGRTGRIEGRPFTSSVRKLARRASNSRAVL